MSRAQTIRDELDDNPAAKGYLGMNDADAAIAMNEQDQTQDRDTITAALLLDSTMAMEFSALSIDQKSIYKLMISAGEIILKGANTQAALVMFSGTATGTNLDALRTVTVSRSAIIGVSRVRTGDITEARALP